MKAKLFKCQHCGTKLTKIYDGGKEYIAEEYNGESDFHNWVVHTCCNHMEIDWEEDVE